MATFIRSNAWKNGGTFNNTDLLWYAKGVGAMQARPLNVTASWWFFAAIHGENIASGFPLWASFTGPWCRPRRSQPRASRRSTGISANIKAGIFSHGIADICWRWRPRSGRT